jgi:phosphate starvation-inducible PhoH-like protein
MTDFSTHHGYTTQGSLTITNHVLCKGESVLSPGGWQPVAQLVAGQALLGSDGGLLEVVQVRRHHAATYRVAFSDGAIATVGADQAWATQTHNDREYAKRDGRRRWRQRSTAEVESLLRSGAKRQTYVPVISAVHYSTQCGLPLDPYGLGLMLGDGSFRDGTPRFTKPEPELHAALAIAFPGNAHTPAGSAGQGTVSLPALTGLNPLTKGLRDLDLWGRWSWNKFVPRVYLTASPSQRLAVIQGLLDTDGWVQRNDSGNTGAHFSTSSEVLACDVIELVRSLGGLTTLQYKPYPRYQRGIGRPAFIVRVNLPRGLEPFRLTRKLDQWRSGRTSIATPPVRSIKSINVNGTQECVSFSVSGHPDTLVLGGFIVT